MKLQENVGPGAEQEHGTLAVPTQRGPELEFCMMVKAASSLWSVSSLACEAHPFLDIQNELKDSVTAGGVGRGGRMREGRDERGVVEPVKAVGRHVTESASGVTDGFIALWAVLAWCRHSLNWCLHLPLIMP